jgi:hypothetical protein
MKQENLGNKKEIRKIIFKNNELPAIIVFESKDGIKEYILKTNTKKTKLLLNKKEY